MNLVVIGGTDFTQHVKVPSYKVNKTQSYKEWEDGNYVKHREITRTKVSGSFTLLYDEVSDLQDFFDTVESLRSASDTGAIQMTLYLNNIHTVETVTAFISYTPPNENPHMQIGDLSSFEVTIEEQ